MNTLDIPLEFGIENKKLYIDADYIVRNITFSLPLQYIFGFQKEFVSSSERYHADFYPQLNRAYDHMLIYCDIIKPISVGGSKVPLLKTLFTNSRLNLERN